MHTYRIVHDMPGRIRIRYGQYAFSTKQAIALKHMFKQWSMVQTIEVNEITGSVLFTYDCSCKEALLKQLTQFKLDEFDLSPYLDIINNNSYELMQKEAQEHYTNKFIKLIIRHYRTKWFLPQPIKHIRTVLIAFKYFKTGWKSLKQGKIDVPLLDATSIGVSMLNHQFSTASSIMFLLSISQLLEDYTKKKTSLQLKENLSLRFERIWVLQNNTEMEINSEDLKKNDIVIIQTGAMIPVDGEIVAGEAMVNESSFTGEPLSKAVSIDDTVFAGTVVEEGKIFVRVRNLQQDSRISKIVDLIDNNENLKASIQSQAEHLADSIVPYSFLGFFGLLLLTRNLARATSILLVDYSCAIKLSTSITIISTMQEASNHAIIVKGGKYLEALANSNTIVFDKTGTLTNATPVVQEVIALGDYTRKEVLKIAACLEEHFPHSVANAIVKQAYDEGLNHQEEHAEVEYIIAHGIATQLHGKKTIIGSEHFVFEDEQVPPGNQLEEIISSLQDDGANSFIYLAIGGQLAGIISINDPLKDEALQVVHDLKERGIEHVVMLTGDGKNAASHIANKLGIDDYQYNVLPEDKATYIRKLQSEGEIVIMVGDGVNDTPALSSADVSISMLDSSAIARELADVTITSNSLEEIVILKELAISSMQRIKNNYRHIVIFNSLLILAGAIGLMPASSSALLHNASTFIFAASSTKPLLQSK